MTTFFIFSLPRSGTAWLSNFLTYDSCFCFHELFGKARSFENFNFMMNDTGREVVGNSDCSNVFFGPQLSVAYPEAKIVVVRKNLNAVKASMAKAGLEEMDLVERVDKFLAEMSLHYFTLNFANMFEEGPMCQLWNYLEIPDKFDKHRFYMMKNFVINIRGAKEMAFKEESEEILANMSPGLFDGIQAAYEYLRR